MTKEFKITKLFQTQNNCYKTGKIQVVKGVMWHSTGANNPYLSRYVGPDDGILGVNKYNNHWNQPKPDGRSVCVHAWIGYTKDKKSIATYQTLPWNHVGWHSGVGSKGSANTKGYIGFEICEDGLRDKEYFDEVYRQGVELTAYLCKTYNIPVNATTIIDHTTGNKMGIASNHGDIAHWFKIYGKTMDDVRKDVIKRLDQDNVEELIKLTLQNWQKEMGEKAIDNLSNAKIVDSPEKWKSTLGENVPQWLFWSIVDRITKEVK